MRYLLTTVCLLAMASNAMAQTVNQNGQGNSAIQTNTNSGNTTTNSNNPHITANGGEASARSSSTSSSSSRSSQKQGQAQLQGQKQTSTADNAGNTQTQNYAAQKRNPVSTAFAAPLVASDETCAYSTSFGAQVIGTGLSGAPTHEAQNCVGLKNSRELERKGFKKASLALLCMNDEVRQAMDMEGGCPSTPAQMGKLSPTSGEESAAPEKTIHEYPTSGKVWK